MKKRTDYKSAGVNIDAGNEAVDRIKKSIKTTFSDNILFTFWSDQTCSSIFLQFTQAQPVKSITTAEGGVVTTNVKKYYDAMIDMKEKQDDAYSNILSHLEKLKNEQNITDEILEDVIQEQKKVERKKEDIKKQIDDIIIAENL